MKKTLFLAIITLISVFTIKAQNGFNYKALITDNGNALSNQNVDVRFSILDNSGTLLYQEEHSTVTDESGIIIVIIGEGNVISGDFSTLDSMSDIPPANQQEEKDKIINDIKSLTFP